LTAVAVIRGGRLVWVDPADFPRVRAVADALAGLLPRVPMSASDTDISNWAVALRHLLSWLGEIPEPPERMEWLTADLLDAWVEQRKRTQPGTAQALGSRVRTLLLNRPADMHLHGSLLAADGQALTWTPPASQIKRVTSDLRFSTLSALRDVAARDVRNALARMTAVTQMASSGVDPGTDAAAWRVQVNVWRAAMDGNLSARRLEANLGHEVGMWPQWLQAILPSTLPARNVPWSGVAVGAIHSIVFPTFLEVTAGYVWMMLATGLPPALVFHGDLKRGD
jgi:hypothetical protein